MFYKFHLLAYLLFCGVSVKSMSVVESDSQLRLLTASSDGYIKLYDVSVEVCHLHCQHCFALSLQLYIPVLILPSYVTVCLISWHIVCSAQVI